MSTANTEPASQDVEAAHSELYESAIRTGQVPAQVQEAESRSISSTHPQSSSSSTEGEYEDSHIILRASDRTLTIKHWLISHPTLTIPLSSIRSLVPASELKRAKAVKPWGVSITGIGWARDFKRLLPVGRAWERSWVVDWDGKWGGLRAGFTVDRVGEFSRAVEALEPGVLERGREGEEGMRGHEGYAKLEDEK